MSAPSGYEQLVLELINRARLDPNAEASRLGVSLNEGLSPGQISADSKQPLAYSSVLNNAAAGHSSWMLANNVFSHTGAGGSGPGDRMTAAGYQFTGSWTWGENIAWNGTTGTLNVLASTQLAHDGLFESSGHRLNLLNDNFNEVGLGAETGVFTSGANYNAFMLTENFAKTGSGSFITGVAYTDSDSNEFYSIGEGRGNVTVSFSEGGSGIGSTSTWSSGGYGLKTTATGDIAVTFSDGGLPARVRGSVTLEGENIKFDLIGTDRIESSSSTNLGQNAVTLELLGLNNIDGIGNNLNNTILGNAGDNNISGRTGSDRIKGRAGNDSLRGASGNDTLVGGAGDDELNGGRNNDFLFGGNGDDRLVGSSGNDSLSGGSQDDRLISGSGDDTLDGGAGDDLLDGFADSVQDIFIFDRSDWGKDRVRNFEDGTDILDMTGSGVTSLADLTITQLGDGSALVRLDADNFIRLFGTDISLVNSTDFLFDV